MAMSGAPDLGTGGLKGLSSTPARPQPGRLMKAARPQLLKCLWVTGSCFEYFSTKHKN